MKMNKGLMKKIAATGMALSMMAATGAVAFADDTQDAAAQDTPKAAVEQEMDYGTLSTDEIAQLNAIYDRFDAIMNEIFASIDDSAFENMTEDQLDALFAPYEDELAELDAKATALEEKGGLYDWTDDDQADNFVTLS